MNFGKVIIFCFSVLFFTSSCSEKLPENELDRDADLMTQKMFEAINKEAWDSTQYVAWTFVGKHHYVWDKFNHWVEIKWKNKRVLLDTKAVDGFAYEDDELVTDEKARRKLIDRSWSFFANDSWWLNAPAKAMDSGVSREVVELKDGRVGLKVHYSSGGVTPGDSYVWLFDENYLPTSYKMWVSIIPIKGIESTWSDWVTIDGGAKIATSHKTSLLTVKTTNLAAGPTLSFIGKDESLFDPLKSR